MPHRQTAPPPGVLEIVEDEEEPLLPNCAEDRRVERFFRPLAHIERLRDRVRHEGRIAHGSERDEEDAVRHLRAQFVRDRNREPCLSHTARAGNCQETHRCAADHRGRRPHHVRTPNKRRNLSGQVRRRRQHRRECGHCATLRACKSEETVTFIIGKIERVGEQAKRFAVGALLRPAFDIPDGPDAEGRPLRQFLLRQPRRDSVSPQQITDRLRMQGARFPMGTPLPFSRIDCLRRTTHPPSPFGHIIIRAARGTRPS